MKKIKVLLLTFNVCGNYSLSLAFLKAYSLKSQIISKRANIQIKDFCIIHNDERQALYYINERKPDVIGFSCYGWNINKTLYLSRLIKQILPNVKIILGGPEVGPIAEKYLKENPSIDVIVRGEGEVTFSESLEYYITSKNDLKNILGISYRKENKIFNNKDRPVIENLDDIPSPYLNGIIDMKKYSMIILQTYRGCIFKCNYCYFNPGSESKLRFFSLKRVEEELKWILSQVSNIDSKHIYYCDSIFNLKPKRVEKICNIIYNHSNKEKITFQAECQLEFVTEEIVKNLSKLKINYMESGVQSSDSIALKNINRFFHKKKFIKGVRLLNKYNVNCLLGHIIGLPGDNFFKCAKSLKFSINLKPWKITSYILNVLPGTILFNTKKFNMKFEDTGNHFILNNYTFPFDEIQKAKFMSRSIKKEYNIKHPFSHIEV